MKDYERWYYRLLVLVFVTSGVALALTIRSIYQLLTGL